MSACAKYHSCVKRVSFVGLTGSPSQGDIDRCVQAVYNGGSSAISQFYDIIPKPSYRIGPPFPFKSCYEFLSKHSVKFDSGTLVSPISDTQANSISAQALDGEVCRDVDDVPAAARSDCIAEQVGVEQADDSGWNDS